MSESNASQHQDYKVGTIYTCSWGYDQTNADFYVVTRETPHTVTLQRIATQHIDGRAYPDPTRTLEDRKPKRCKKQLGYRGERPWLRINTYSGAKPYEGGGCFDTAAAGQAGH